DIERMNQIRLTGAPHLPAMLARREDVSALKQFLVVIGFVTLDLVEDVFEADHEKGKRLPECRTGALACLTPVRDRRGRHSTTGEGACRTPAGAPLAESRSRNRRPRGIAAKRR